jgi:hypothetical protein
VAFGDIIDSYAEAAESSITLNYGTDVATPTEGNLLLMVFGDRSNGTTTPSGWTEIYTVDPWSNSSSTRTCVYAKIASASESNVTFSVTNGRPAFAYYEVEGPFEALSGSPLDIIEHTGHAEATNVDEGTGLQPGTSGTLSQADTFALAATTWRGTSGSNEPTSTAADSGFTASEFTGYNGFGAFTYGLISAYKVTSATTALNPSLTWTQFEDNSPYTAVSVLVVLKKEAAGGGTDALTPDDLATGAPTVGSPAIGQVHALIALDLTSGMPALDTPDLGQVHALAADDIATASPTLDEPTIGQVHGLAADDVTAGTPTLSTPTLSESNVLDADDLATGTPTLSSPALGQIHALSANDLVTDAPTVETIAIGQIHALSADDLTTGAPTLSTPVIGTEGTDALAPDDLTTGAPILSSPVLGQIHSLSADDLTTDTPIIETVVIGQIHAIIAADVATGTPILSAPDLSAAAGVTPLTAIDITTGAPILTAPVLGQIHGLTGDDVTAGAPTITAPELFDFLAAVGAYGTVTRAAAVGTVSVKKRAGTVTRAA